MEDSDLTKVSVTQALATRSRLRARRLNDLADMLERVPAEDAMNVKLRWRAPQIGGGGFPTPDQWDTLAANADDVESLVRALDQIA